MQYWKNFKNGKVERVEDEQVLKHPELIELYKNQGYIQIMGEDDDKPDSKPKKKRFKKKKK